MCEDYSKSRSLRETCCSLLTIAIGLLSCSVMGVLIYFSYLAIAGSISYCSLWTDVPGRIGIFLTFYYAAGLLGILPIPDRFRVNCLPPPPFIIYSIDSWRNLFRNLHRILGFNRQEYETFASDDRESLPVRDVGDGRPVDSSPISQQTSEKIPIPVKTNAARTHHIRYSKGVRNKDVELASSSEELSISFDSPAGGHIVPMVKGKSSKPRYLPDSSTSTTVESSDKSASLNASTENPHKVSETFRDALKVSAEIHDENDASPKTHDAELSLPKHSRFSWNYLGSGIRVSKEAKNLRKSNVDEERREIEEYNKKRKMEETVASSKDSEQGWKTDSDELLNAFSNRHRRFPIIPQQSKTGFRGRTKTTPGYIRKLKTFKTKIHKRNHSYSPYKYQKCERSKMSSESEDNSGKNENRVESSSYSDKSPSHQSEAGHTEKAFRRSGQSLQDGGEVPTSWQYLNVLPGKSFDINTSCGALTSRQNVGFPSNQTDGETSTSWQNIHVLPSKISDINASSESLTSRQPIGSSSKISDSSADDEASTSDQNIDGTSPGTSSNSNTGEDAGTFKQPIDGAYSYSNDDL